jgi:hypothetical protein
LLKAKKERKPKKAITKLRTEVKTPNNQSKQKAYNQPFNPLPTNKNNQPKKQAIVLQIVTSIARNQ